MSYNPPLLSVRRIKWAWRFRLALRAERLEDAEAGLRHLEKMAEVGPLPFISRVVQAALLLRGKRGAEAQAALTALVNNPDNPDSPLQQYLVAYCESLLEGIWRRECMAKVGKVAPNIPGLRFYPTSRFPIPDCRYCEVIKSL